MNRNVLRFYKTISTEFTYFINISDGKLSNYKINKINLLVMIVLPILVSCGNNSSQKNDNLNFSRKNFEKVKIKLDSIEVNITPKTHPIYNDIAKYIAGMELHSSSVINSSLTNNNSWKQFSNNFNKSWAKLDSLHLKKMFFWREKELKIGSSKTVFYPFSGADFLNEYTLFPKADQYIMVGLEPIGSIPDFQKNMSSDTIASYFSALNKALQSIMINSFFKTIGMSDDFKNKNLNGTIHLILLFLARTGNSIVDIKPVDINNIGEIVDANIQNTLSSNGIEIDFINSDSIVKKIFYFSVNLDNNHLSKNQNFTTFINKQADMVTYIKSASYLLHQNHFTIIRNLILSNSNYVLEDDSGIPYKYFNTKEWVPTFFGKYTGPINLFSTRFQEDLDSCYKNNSSAKFLNFGIGYKCRIGESNLLLFKKTN